jgi:ubiquinone/menaquinone biosynthesis C-methylase UbiE
MEKQSILDFYYNLIDKERNIYELAELIEQNRKPVSEYIDFIQNPETGNTVTLDEIKDKIENNLINFISNSKSDEKWQKLNKQFLNYHKSLSVYEIMNSTPIINYISLDSGIGLLKNIKVADIGGGTGHAYCSFFQYPETIDYFLVDPNLRLMHDQFFRIYPKISLFPISHILAKAENLPFKNDTFDLTMSLSSIDHMEDYRKFISEAKRITKPGGLIFISSHLDIPASQEDTTKTTAKLFNFSFFERLTRYLYFRKYGVKADDHTFHFETIDSILSELNKNNLTIKKNSVFKRHFYIVASKPM